MTKAISILGSTGSIGRQTLDVADDLGLRVAALSANRDVDRMEAQCRRYRPELAVLMEESAAKALKVRLADTTIRVASGMDGLLEAATLMNKGLEVIEAMRLYGLPLEQVTAIIHRQSVIHSLVEFVDGAVMAQLGVPDMRIPIGLAMTYPTRLHNPAPALDLLACGNLNFAEIDEAAFPCFALAKQAARIGGTACAAMNAANEAAVARYLRDEIGFYDIPAAVERALALPVMQNPTLNDILAIDAEARRIAAAL